jgi:hypothetical protein
MADVPVYVAVITASSALLGAAISPVSTALQNARQAKRDRAERHETALRDACVDLLRAAGGLRDQVANNHDYQGGGEISDRLDRVRKYATDARVHAVRIALLEPHSLAEPAKRLAQAAGQLAVAAAASTDMTIRMSNLLPDFGELDTCMNAFSERAVGYAGGEQNELLRIG